MEVEDSSVPPLGQLTSDFFLAINDSQMEVLEKANRIWVDGQGACYVNNVVEHASGSQAAQVVQGRGFPTSDSWIGRGAAGLDA